MDYEKLASIIADLTTDGHIQLRKKFGVISFYSKEYSEIEKFNSIFESIFNKKGNIFKDERSNNMRYKLFISDTKLAKFLEIKGGPVGNKTNTNFRIPLWIFNGSEKIQKIYLQRLFDGEGSIFHSKDGRWRLFFTMNKNEILIEKGILYFNEIKELLSKFGIKTSKIRIHEGKIRKDKSKSKNMKIEIKKCSILDFYKKINFSNLNKREKLEQAVNEIF